MILPQNIIAIDLETTDSDAMAGGEIVQIGAVIVKPDLSLGATFRTYVKPRTAYRNSHAMVVNQISEEVLDNAPDVTVALNNFERFCLENSYSRRPMLSAWGAYFDISFLRQAYRNIGRDYPFSYRCIDLKTIAIWEQAKADDPLSGGVSTFLEKRGMQFEGMEHDALDDIKNTMRIIQSYGENRRR